MGEKRAVSRVNARRYRRADKAGKKRILDEFTQITGYNRKYAIHLLATWGQQRYRCVGGRLVRFIVGKPARHTRRVGRRRYGEPVRQALAKIWALFDYMCGKRLAVLIRLNLELLTHQPELGISEAVAERLSTISAATIDRLLAPERGRLALKGRSHTRAGTLLKQQIPIRTFYDWDERQPGFFELDTVAHDGGASSGEYCFTLTATDVYSGWVELRALPNRAHRWVKEQVEKFPAELPFPLKGIDSDNGGEFINHQLLAWCNEKRIQFTRARSYRKNDNCFVEQKNDLAVRRTVGYYRFDSEAEYQALAEVYRHLCPLLNFYYPSVRILEKTRVGARLKKRYDAPKPPYQRLLESADLSEEAKTELRRRAGRLHLVKQKRLVDQALLRLLRLHEEKQQRRLPLDSGGAPSGQG